MFNQFESSRHDAQPIKLYKFNFGVLPEDELRYTDADTEQSFENKQYVRTAITHSEITATAGSIDNTTLTVRMSKFTDLSEIFRMSPPSYTVTLILYQGSANDPDNQFLAAWGGRVINASWEGNELVLTCEPVVTSLRRPGLRRNYQRNCPHALYDQEIGSCRAPKIGFDVSVLEVYANNVIRTTDFGDPQRFYNGHMEWRTPEGRRMLVSIMYGAAGGILQLANSPIGMVVGTAIRMYRGCDHTLGPYGCAMHNNIPNYGGQPWIPLTNPVNKFGEF